MMRSAALQSYRDGRPLVLLDARFGHAPATLVLAAESIDAEMMAFVVRYTGGFVTVALPSWRCDQLRLPAIAADPHYRTRPVAAVSTDAADGVSTGISATDRSFTARLLADPATTPDLLSRPGHVVPMRVPDAVGTGVMSAWAAGLRLCELADLAAAAVCCELVEESGELMSASAAREFAQAHGLLALTRGDVARFALDVPAAQPA
jgi:3,4-dihydroxy 2-butanone 4-phosphate synthase/GTP cyclohydrolase II